MVRNVNQKYSYFLVSPILTEELEYSGDDSHDPAPKHSAQPQGLGQNAKAPHSEITLQPDAQANAIPPYKDKDRA